MKDSTIYLRIPRQSNVPVLCQSLEKKTNPTVSSSLQLFGFPQFRTLCILCSLASPLYQNYQDKESWQASTLQAARFPYGPWTQS
ncbi:hypothetical protein N665_1099s0008 [Sinapis alba]|nr:hypothetical protein N665_1099s0008 [Sinapis alba]